MTSKRMIKFAERIEAIREKAEVEELLVYEDFGKKFVKGGEGREAQKATATKIAEKRAVLDELLMQRREVKRVTNKVDRLVESLEAD